MKKVLIASGVALVAFASVVAAQSFNTNLTVGSTGADVSALQTLLISKGYSIPAIASGAATPGYFGSQTKTAVMAYQAANGIPNTGFVGPLTRASLNAGGGSGTVTPPTGWTCPVGMICTPVGGGAPVSTGGEEGQLKNFDSIGDVESSLDEGDEENVLGIEVEAEDSDMTIERVDVDFAVSSESGSDNLDDYIEEVSVWFDGKKVASKDVDSADEDDGIYSFRFTGINSVVKDGDTSQIYIQVSTVGNVDSGDDTSWDVYIPDDGIRAVDEAGISDTYVTGAEGGQDAELSETFTVGEATTGDLDITEGAGTPDSMIVTVDDENDTNGVTVLVIDVEADNQDIEITDLPVGLVATGADVDQIVKTAKLMDGSTVLDSKTIPSTAGTSYEVVFDNIDLTVGDGDTKSLKVFVDINDLEGTYGEGDSLYATTTGSAAAWDVEDQNGETVTPDGSLTGGNLSFYQNGIAVTLVSKSNGAAYSSSEGSGVKSKVDYTIVFDVKAIGSHAILDMDTARVQVTDPTTGTDGLAWSTTTASTVGTTTVSAVLSPSEDVTEDDNENFFIQENDTRRFTLNVTLENQSSANGSAAIRLRGLKWAATSTRAITESNTAADQLYTFNLDSFVTSASNLFDN